MNELSFPTCFHLLRLLAGSSWGASATTLRTSALALCYSTAEYCAPVWARSPYTKLIDVQLSESMHSVSGAPRPTPLPWLPVLSHITPPHIRRSAATNQLLSKIRSSTVSLPLISDILKSHPEVRLTSRRPIWLEESQQGEVSPRQKWTEEWAASDVVNCLLIVDLSIAPPEFDLRRGLCSITFGLARVDVQPTSSAGIRLQIHPVPVEHLHKLCRTL